MTPRPLLPRGHALPAWLLLLALGVLACGPTSAQGAGGEAGQATDREDEAAGVPASQGASGHDLREDGARVPISRAGRVDKELDRRRVALGDEDWELVEISYYDHIDIADTLAFDADGHVWFVSSWGDREIRISPDDLTMEEFHLPKGCGPRALGIDGRGAHWLICMRADVLLEAYPHEGYAVVHRPDAPGFMNFVTVDRRRNVVWIGKPSQNSIVRFDRESGFRQYEIPTFDGGPGIADLDSEGRVWFPQLYGNKLTRFDPESESFDEYPLPTENALPVVTMVDSEGRVWTSEHAQDRIAIFEDGRFREIELPSQNSGVNALAEAPDGRVWFAQGGWRGSMGSNRIGRLDPSTGEVEEVALPTANSQPVGLRVGPGGGVWFVEMGTGNIGLVRRADPEPKPAG